MTDGSRINLPTWTDYQKKNGLDPLGMQNSSVSLYQKLLPGISNVTLRIRYYGLYAWLCRTYAKTDGSNDPERWKTFVRRAEALYALIAFRAGNQGGVAGIQWAERAHSEAVGDVIDFASAADPNSEIKYLKQAWGAYGAAYGSQLFAIGVFRESPDHLLPVPSEAYGDPLADSFDSDLGELTDLFSTIIARGLVTKGEVERLAPLVPSEIAASSDECAVYQRLLLSPIQSGDNDAVARRLSLLLVLKITAMLQRDPTPDEVRWILYSNRDAEGRLLDLNASDLEDHRQRWWVYQANDLCHIVYETLLKFTLDTLAAYATGLPLERLIPICLDRILEAMGQVPENWAQMLEGTNLAANSFASDEENSESSLSSSILKSAGRKGETECSPQTAWKAIQLLGVLHKRVREENHPIESELGGRFEREEYQTLLTEVRFLDDHLDLPFQDLVGKIIEVKIIRRHLWVAARKFQSGDYTFLIEADEGRLRVRGKDGPVVTNPRLDPAISFLKDVHLIGTQGLTSFGVEALSAQ